MHNAKINDILAFWFGPLADDGLSEPTQHGLWFKSSKETDEKIKHLFGGEVARGAIEQGKHLQLPLIHRVFLYLPLEHTEDLATQEQCLSLYQEMAEATGLEQMEGFARYAKAHRDVIAQLGRFPHRNALLGRDSTPAEQDHLATHGGF